VNPDDRLPVEDPFDGDEGLVPAEFADAVRVWHALQQLRPVEAVRAVAALDPDELRRLLLTSLLFRGSRFYTTVHDGAVVVRGDDLGGEARADVRRGLGRLLNAVTDVDEPR
jgi:hypothetical protein